LQQLYGANQEFSMTRDQGGGATVRIKVPCRFDAVERSS
jgi:hypothetical protein